MSEIKCICSKIESKFDHHRHERKARLRNGLSAKPKFSSRAYGFVGNRHSELLVVVASLASRQFGDLAADLTITAIASVFFVAALGVFAILRRVHAWDVEDRSAAG